MGFVYGWKFSRVTFCTKQYYWSVLYKFSSTLFGSSSKNISHQNVSCLQKCFRLSFPVFRFYSGWKEEENDVWSSLEAVVLWKDGLEKITLHADNGSWKSYCYCVWWLLYCIWSYLSFFLFWVCGFFCGWKSAKLFCRPVLRFLREFGFFELSDGH